MRNISQLYKQENKNNINGGGDGVSMRMISSKNCADIAYEAISLIKVRDSKYGVSHLLNHPLKWILKPLFPSLVALGIHPFYCIKNRCAASSSVSNGLLIDETIHSNCYFC
jgi:hypothetical protein